MGIKNYVGFVNDHSGSMAGLKLAAMTDYNANILAVKNAASREMLDTIVSVVGIGTGPYGKDTERQVIVSNPHVLKPITNWSTDGGTPLWDGIGNMIELLKSVPDFSRSDVSFLVMITTDGEEMHSSKYTESRLAALIRSVSSDGRWTFVFRVPRGQAYMIPDSFGIPAGNIQEWDTTTAGMAASTQATTAAVDTFYATRATGQKSSTVFYANATAVDTSKLVDVSKRTSLYVVEAHEDGNQIRDFILRRRTRYLKGSAFYQLTKTEPRVGPNKILAVRDRSTGVVFAGKEARTMLGLSSVDNIRLHPGDHGNYDLFIQSESVNRKLVAGTGVLYWEEIGVPFTQAEIDRFTGVAAAPVAPAKPAVVQLPKVTPTNKPTPSPLKPTPKASVFNTYTDGQGRVRQMPIAIAPSDSGRVRFYVAPPSAKFYSTRDMARAQATVQGKKSYDAGPTAANGQRFYVA